MEREISNLKQRASFVMVLFTMSFEDELLDLLREKSAYLEGHFLLSSGLHSPNYMQCARILQFPRIAGDLGKRIHEKLQNETGHVDLVLSPALGGIIIGHEVARSWDVPFLFCEREDGQMRLRRFEMKPGQNVVVIEDVVTTGGSTKETIAVAEKLGSKIVGIGSIVDRAATPPDFPAVFRSLLKLPLDHYQPESCPLCSKNIPLVKPGSRQISK
jgi:orotate phosphoribosyltransferase